MHRTLLALLLATALPSFALAHIGLTDPPPRPGMESPVNTPQKTWPCGGLPRDPNPTVLTPGATLDVSWVEGIDHPGWYRIVFSVDGQTGFEDPANWLLNDLPDQPGRASYTETIQLPAISCSDCVLQVVQIMTDKSPDPTTPSGEQEYYACADLVLTDGSGSDGGSPDSGAATDAGESSDGGSASDAGAVVDAGGSSEEPLGCSCTSSQTPSLTALLMLGLLLLLRFRLVAACRQRAPARGQSVSATKSARSRR